MVRLDPSDGYIYLGRRDRMVKRRGYRIELGEIERGLYQHASILEAGVIGVPDDAAGMRIIAYLTARAQERPSIIEMKSFCAGHLPSYMSPDVFRFLEALPRTSTDKIDYQSLTRLADGGKEVVMSTSTRSAELDDSRPPFQGSTAIGVRELSPHQSCRHQPAPVSAHPRATRSLDCAGLSFSA